MHDLIRDLRYTVRRLARTPGFTVATVLTLALGIGANTAIFSVIHSVLLKPLPFPEPERLIGVWQTAPGVNIKDLNASIADYVTYREHSRTFADVALMNGRTVTVVEGGEAEQVQGLSATFRLLPMLGVRPAHGRTFVEGDDAESNPDVVMLGYEYWQRRFGGDPKVIGRRIMADGTAREVVGILPRGFWFMDMRHDIVTPLQFERGEVRLGGYGMQAVARLKPGVTLEQANADIKRMIGIELSTFPPRRGMSLKMLQEVGLGPNARPLMDDLVGDISKSLWMIMATVGMVLLIACANVANLLVVRAEGRTQELAVRAALGAGRGRIARELFAESLVLALMGGALGAVMAVGVVKLVVAFGPARLPRLEQIAVDGTALWFTLAASVAAGFAFGAIPVVKHAGVRLAGALHAGGRTASVGRERNLARKALTVVQVALALVLLVGSGLMIRTFVSMREVKPGFSDARTLQTFRVAVPRNVAEAEAERRLLFQRVVNRLEAVPGVRSVGMLTRLPMTDERSQDPMYASDRTYAANEIPKLRRFETVTPGTFETMGTPVVAGREYNWTDILEKRQVIVISENFAREYWGSAQGAVGKRMRSNVTDPWSEVVGVVGDVRQDGVDKAAPTTVYWPLRNAGGAAFVLRGGRAGTASYTEEIRRAVAEVNPNLPVSDVRTMEEVYERSLSRTAFTLTLLAISGAMAFLLAVVGIYAVISYAVAQRRREIGIRMALGAQQGQLKALFVRQGLVWSGMGVAAGLAGAVGLSRLIATLLHGISPLDPVTYGAVAAGLLAAAGLASYLPARRIARVDPMESLRSE